MRFCSIASGSSGNCIYIGAAKTSILIDVGVSGKRITKGLEDIGVDPKTVDGLLITHEHSDHICGIGVILRKYHIPIYATPKTINAILEGGKYGKLDPELFHPINYDEDFQLGEITIHPFEISHDAAQPVAYVLRYQDKGVGVATDMGYFDERIVNNLSGLDALLLEANHDVKMLEVGAYPYYLKQRILGDKGHLSNENCGRLLSRIMNKKMKVVFLGHLSKENNYPQLAYEAVSTEITLSDCCFRAGDIPLKVAPRDQASELIYV